MTARARFLAAGLFACMPAAARAQAGAEGFLLSRTAGDARAAALGGAADPLPEGLAATAANPAGLALRREKAFADTLLSWPSGFVGDTLGGELPAGDAGGIAASLTLLRHESLPVTTEIRPDGTGGLVGILSGELTLVGGQWISEQQAAGVALRLLHEELGDRKTEALAADAGLVRVLAPEWTAGVAVRGLGRIIRAAASRDPFPLAVLGGVRYELPDLPARAYAAADWQPYGSNGVAFGAEGGELFGIALRLGVAVRAATGTRVTGGLGYHAGLWAFDYAYAPVADLGVAHRLTLSLRFGS